MKTAFECNRSPLQQISDPLFEDKQVMVYVKRDDLLHPEISGNKWRKLKYNLLEAKKSGFDGLLTFGGAYSNHIYATAAAANAFGFKSKGFIRGEEHLPLNSTLFFAQKQGMDFHYLDREQYRLKSTDDFLNQLKERFHNYYIVPEGGTNEYAIEGASEIVPEIDLEFSHICCACGTGGTLAGIVKSVFGQKVIGFPALKGGGFLRDEIESYSGSGNFDLALDYHFGGYAKINIDLIRFMDSFYAKTSIQLDPVYTAKMFFGLFDMVRNNYFERGSVIVAVHTGGLQGLEGMKSKIEHIKKQVAE